MIKVYLSESIGIRGGSDRVESLNRRRPDLGVGICQGVRKGWDGIGCPAGESYETPCRPHSDFRVGRLQTGDKSRNAKLGSLFEIVERTKCGLRDSRVVRIAKAVYYSRNGKLGGFDKEGHNANGVDSSFAIGMAWVLDDRNQCGQSVCSKASQIVDGPGSTSGCVRVIDESTQIIKRRCRPCPQDVECTECSTSKLLGSRLNYASREAECFLVRESFDQFGEFYSPVRRLVLNPFSKKWESCDADVIDGISCCLDLFCVRSAQNLHPGTERMAAVGRLWLCFVREDGDESDCSADAKQDQFSPLSHG